MPALENVAVVLAALASAKVTAPGPLTAVQLYVNAPGGFGKPSSVAEPFKFAASDTAMYQSRTRAHDRGLVNRNHNIITAGSCAIICRETQSVDSAVRERGGRVSRACIRKRHRSRTGHR